MNSVRELKTETARMLKIGSEKLAVKSSIYLYAARELEESARKLSDVFESTPEEEQEVLLLKKECIRAGIVVENLLKEHDMSACERSLFRGRVQKVYKVLTDVVKGAEREEILNRLLDYKESERLMKQTASLSFDIDKECTEMLSKLEVVVDEYGTR